MINYFKNNFKFNKRKKNLNIYKNYLKKNNYKNFYLKKNILVHKDGVEFNLQVKGKFGQKKKIKL